MTLSARMSHAIFLYHQDKNFFYVPNTYVSEAVSDEESIDLTTAICSTTTTRQLTAAAVPIVRSETPSTVMWQRR